MVGTPVDPRRIVEILSSRGHGKALGIAYIDHGPDWIELSLTQRPELIADPMTGVIASGPVVTLLDTATSMAGWLKRGVFQLHVTLDLRVDYLRPAKPAGHIFARGECYSLKRNILFVRGIAHDGDPDDPIAHCVGSFMSLEDRPVS